MKTMEKNAVAANDYLSETEECRQIAQRVAREITELYNADLTEEEAEERRERGEDADIYDYCESALDVEFTLNSQKQLIDVTLYVALGGPTVWVDTRRQEVRCHWGFGDAWSGLDSEICEAIAAHFEECMDF